MIYRNQKLYRSLYSFIPCLINGFAVHWGLGTYIFIILYLQRHHICSHKRYTSLGHVLCCIMCVGACPGLCIVGQEKAWTVPTFFWSAQLQTVHSFPCSWTYALSLLVLVFSGVFNDPALLFYTRYTPSTCLMGSLQPAARFSLLCSCICPLCPNHLIK